MDHYIPKRRIPVTLWASGHEAMPVHLFLDLDGGHRGHTTLLDALNLSAPFLAAAVGSEGRIHLVNKSRILRVTPGRGVLQSDVFARGFDPWREEEATCVLADGTELDGKVWMPMMRATQRLSDHMNQVGDGFIVVLTAVGPHLVSPRGVVELRLSESAGAPLSANGLEDAAA
jgi:hypothetical protein